MLTVRGKCSATRAMFESFRASCCCGKLLAVQHTFAGERLSRRCCDRVKSNPPVVMIIRTILLLNRVRILHAPGVAFFFLCPAPGKT